MLRKFLGRRSVATGSQDFMKKIEEKWKHMYRDRSVPVEASTSKIEDAWSPEPLIRALILQHIEETPLPMSPASRYYVLRKDIQEILASKPKDFKRLRKMKAAQSELEKQQAEQSQREERRLQREETRQSHLNAMPAILDTLEDMHFVGPEVLQMPMARMLQHLKQMEPKVTRFLRRVHRGRYRALSVEDVKTCEGKATMKAAVKVAAKAKKLKGKPQAAEDPAYTGFNDFVARKTAKVKSRDYTFSFEEFIQMYKEVRRKFLDGRRLMKQRKLRQRRNHGFLNRSFQEEEEVYEAEEEEFGDEWRKKSILEDLWRAETYRQTFCELKKDLPEREAMAFRKDRLADIVRDAVHDEFLDMERPILSHELADYENPYMMKRSAMERLLHERCVRNQLDERMMPRLLDAHPDLVKLRRQARLPPEVVEPLSAFRGETRWSFEPRERLVQKLEGVQAALTAVKEKKDVHQVLDELPENRSPAHPSGLHHPWRNHLGFESAVPRGVAGGTKYGQPEDALQTELQQLRYPTLQRVAHTLPRDLKWRAHVVRSIRVLERSKEWDFKSKVDAINRMKEVYDYMKPSEEYTSGLDEKMPVNRVASRIKRKYAPEAEYVRTTHKNWYREKSFVRYRPSLTATTPLRKDKKK